MQDDTRADWHASRARTLTAPGGYAARVERCGAMPAVRIHCRACGESHDIPARCAVTVLCPSCAKRRALRYQQRIERALANAQRDARRRWNAEGRQRMRAPRLVIVTLTTRATGNLAADRRTIRGGHERLRAWLHHRVGSPAYVRAWETTCGSSGVGHAHAHVATLLPYLDYRALRTAWMRATRGASTGLHVSSGPRKGKLWTPESAAGYVAKYVSKGASTCACCARYGCERTDQHRHPTHELPETVASQWLDASAGMRAVTASRRLLPPFVWECPTCEETRGAECDATWKDGDWHNRPVCARGPPGTAVSHRTGDSPLAKMSGD